MTEPDDPSDAARLQEYAGTLADGVESALAGWVERVVHDRWLDWRGREPPAEVAEAARRAGDGATAEVGPLVRELLAADVDAQWTNPLALVRRAVPHATRVLREAGMPEVVRDDHAVRLFPDDAYDLTPASFADLDPGLHDAGLRWGAAKAHVVLARRRREGRR